MAASKLVLALAMLGAVQAMPTWTGFPQQPKFPKIDFPGSATGNAQASLTSGTSKTPFGGFSSIEQAGVQVDGTAEGNGQSVGQATVGSASLTDPHGQTQQHGQVDSSSLQMSGGGFPPNPNFPNFPNFPQLPNPSQAEGQAAFVASTGKTVGPDGSVTKITSLSSQASGSASNGGSNVATAGGSNTSQNGHGGSSEHTQGHAMAAQNGR